MYTHYYSVRPTYTIINALIGKLAKTFSISRNSNSRQHGPWTLVLTFDLASTLKCCNSLLQHVHETTLAVGNKDGEGIIVSFRCAVNKQ